MRKIATEFNLKESDIEDIYKTYWTYIYKYVSDFSSDKSEPIINVKGLGKFKYRVFNKTNKKDNEDKED